MPSTSRRAVLGLLAGVVGVAGCAGRDPSGPATETERRTSTRLTQSTTTGARPPDEPALTAPRPSTLDAVDGDTATETDVRRPAHRRPLTGGVSPTPDVVVAGGPPAVAGEYLYAGSRTGVAAAVDLTAGEPAWQYTFDTALDLTGPAVADGVCVFGSAAGLVTLAAE